MMRLDPAPRHGDRGRAEAMFHRPVMVRGPLRADDDESLQRDPPAPCGQGVELPRRIDHCPEPRSRSQDLPDHREIRAGGSAPRHAAPFHERSGWRGLLRIGLEEGAVGQIAEFSLQLLDLGIHRDTSHRVCVQMCTSGDDGRQEQRIRVSGGPAFPPRPRRHDSASSIPMFHGTWRREEPGANLQELRASRWSSAFSRPVDGLLEWRAQRGTLKRELQRSDTALWPVLRNCPSPARRSPAHQIRPGPLDRFGRRFGSVGRRRHMAHLPARLGVEFSVQVKFGGGML